MDSTAKGPEVQDSMIVVSGAPCSGKTTHILNNRQEDDIIIDLDRLAVALGASTGTPLSHKMWSVAQGVRTQLVDAALSGLIPGQVWIVDSNPLPESIHRYQRAGSMFRVLDPGRATCLERARERPSPRMVQRAIEAWYRDPPHLP